MNEPAPVPPRAPSIPSFTLDDNGVTFLIVSAAGVGYEGTYDRIRGELATGRRVNVIPTPTAATWLDSIEIERLTGWPMRPALRHPTEPTFDPPGSRVIASPVTLNTLTKWAAGHADNLAISLLCEAVGLKIPTRAEVSLSEPYSQLPAARRALAELAELGVELATATRRPLPKFE